MLILGFISVHMCFGSVEVWLWVLSLLEDLLIDLGFVIGKWVMYLSGFTIRWHNKPQIANLGTSTCFLHPFSLLRHC